LSIKPVWIVQIYAGPAWLARVDDVLALYHDRVRAT
jgi:hypothetical protein